MPKESHEQKTQWIYWSIESCWLNFTCFISSEYVVSVTSFPISIGASARLVELFVFFGIGIVFKNNEKQGNKKNKVVSSIETKKFRALAHVEINRKEFLLFSNETEKILDTKRKN